MSVLHLNLPISVYSHSSTVRGNYVCLSIVEDCKTFWVQEACVCVEKNNITRTLIHVTVLRDFFVFVDDGEG